jgi:hypothetical protein
MKLSLSHELIVYCSDLIEKVGVFFKDTLLSFEAREK